MSTQYLITLSGSMDDLPVAICKSRVSVTNFIAENRPCPVDGRDAIREGPLAAACDAAGYGPSMVYGYTVWKFVDGRPIESTKHRWVDGEWPGVHEWKRMTNEERAEFEAATRNDDV